MNGYVGDFRWLLDSFTGEYRWLSNFWPAQVVFGGLVFASTENAYQAAKCDLVDDRKALSEVGGLSAGAAKRFGQTVMLSPLWNDDVAFAVMRDLNRQKFSPSRNAALSARLLATGDALLVEGNTWHDNRWGSCSCGKFKECTLPGMNWLGMILMQVRSELKEGLLE